MKKRIFSAVLAVLMLIVTPLTVYAGDSDYHNNILKRILFSSGHCQSSSKTQAENYIDMLEIAVYLAIDQSGEKNGDQNKLNFLRQNGVRGIVSEIKDINPSTAFYHRSYTHRGWNFTYIDDKSNWEARKDILLNTAETIFQFDAHYPKSEAAKKREAFCKLLYYQHILGDLVYDDKDTLQLNITSSDTNADFVDKERGLIIAFAHAHPGLDNEDLLMELEDAFHTLFSGSSDPYKKAGFTTVFNMIKKDARTLEGMTGGVNSTERLKKRLDYEERLLELVEAYFPLLLDNEKFFREAFPI